MCEKVIKGMFAVYSSKINFLNNESLFVFKEFINKSTFRRCIVNESIMLEDGSISVI